MSGMMDAVLNVGINPEIRDGLARDPRRPDFAAQLWLRFCRMDAVVVMEMDRAEIDKAVGDRVRRAAEVFGSVDGHSGAGVIFTRILANGRNEPYGDCLA